MSTSRHANEYFHNTSTRTFQAPPALSYCTTNNNIWRTLHSNHLDPISDSIRTAQYLSHSPSIHSSARIALQSNVHIAQEQITHKTNILIYFYFIFCPRARIRPWNGLYLFLFAKAVRLQFYVHAKSLSSVHQSKTWSLLCFESRITSASRKHTQSPTFAPKQKCRKNALKDVDDDVLHKIRYSYNHNERRKKSRIFIRKMSSERASE